MITVIPLARMWLAQRAPDVMSTSLEQYTGDENPSAPFLWPEGRPPPSTTPHSYRSGDGASGGQRHHHAGAALADHSRHQRHLAEHLSLAEQGITPHRDGGATTPRKGSVATPGAAARPIAGGATPGTIPAGLRNNNPHNIKYVGQAGTTPSRNTDQGDPQAVYPSMAAGERASHDLMRRKYADGKKTANQLIAGQGGWTPGNYQAAANVARTMGVSPDSDMRLDDEANLRKFSRALLLQEQGPGGVRYFDRIMRAGGATPSATPGATTPGPRGTATTTAGGPSNYDAIRGNANNAERLGMRPGQDLVQIRTPAGKTATVNRKAAAAFSGFLADLERSGYAINDLGGYNYRTKRGGTSLSQHAYGNAIDINPEANPFQQGLATDLPSNVSQMAARHGVSWGGDWQGKKDPMHFEYTGLAPTAPVAARAADARLAKARSSLMNRGSGPGRKISMEDYEKPSKGGMGGMADKNKHRPDSITPQPRGPQDNPWMGMPAESNDIFTGDKASIARDKAKAKKMRDYINKNPASIKRDI